MGRPLSIGVDARPLAFPGNGNARYLYQMLLELIRMRPNDRYVLFSHRAPHADHNPLLNAPNVVVRTYPRRIPGPIWVQFLLPSAVRREKCDLFWGTISMLPAFARRRLGIPTMVNFHDLNAFAAPDTMVAWSRVQQRILNGSTLSDADAVLCLSQTTREDILRFFPRIDENKLHVVYPGCDVPKLRSRAPTGGAGKLKSFAVTVGTIEPRKNQKTLIEGYRLARRGNSRLPALVVVGRRGWGDDSVYEELASGRLERESIYYLQNAEEEELRWCYEKASFVVCPSLHEGFGLPILEAYLFGLPTLLSDIRIFREVGQNALFVPPLDAGAWSAAFIQFSREVQMKKRRAPKFDRRYWSYKRGAGEIDALIRNLTGV